MSTKPLKKGATYDDLVAVPEHYVAEMFDGELYASPRPALPHARAAMALATKLGGPCGNVGVRARPFDAIELALQALWI